MLFYVSNKLYCLTGVIGSVVSATSILTRCVVCIALILDNYVLMQACSFSVGASLDKGVPSVLHPEKLHGTWLHTSCAAYKALYCVCVCVLCGLVVCVVVGSSG